VMIMRLEHLCLSALGLLGPGTAFASGGDVLGLFWIQAAIILVTLFALAIWRVSIKNKIIVFVGLILGIAVAWYATADIPFQGNLGIIIVINALLPLLGALTAFILAKRL
jgi:hypothetical protein